MAIWLAMRQTSRLQGFIDILKQHGIEGYRIEKDIEKDGEVYKAGQTASFQRSKTSLA